VSASKFLAYVSAGILKIKVDQNEVKLELDSCREIIRVLQEELREISPPMQPAGNKANEDYKDKESYNSLTSEEEIYSTPEERSDSYPCRPLTSSTL
jgi:hypothetical protein